MKLPTRTQALRYLQDWFVHADLTEDGVLHGAVFFYRGRACGWARVARPNHWQPGVIAFDLRTNTCAVACGGDDESGANYWEAVKS